MGYVVRKRANGNWYVQHETYPQGKRTAKSVEPSRWGELGILEGFTAEQARLALRDVNKRERSRSTRVEAIHRRLQEEEASQRFLLPEALVEEFQEELQGLPGAKHLLSNWRAAKRLIVQVNLPYTQYKRREQLLWNACEARGFSTAYVKKIVRVLNLWGEFLESKTGEPYRRLACPRGHARGRLERRYELARKKPKASDGLTPGLLAACRGSLGREHWNWLFVSLWFGLRPQEMRNLGNPGLSYVTVEEGRQLLNIRQLKLLNLPEAEQWKTIPVLYPEQRAALKLFGRCKEPLPRTIKRATRGNHHTYAGRKGFGPLMWEKGHDIVEVSSWLGHKSIDRTYRDYMRWRRLKLRKKEVA